MRHDVFHDSETKLNLTITKPRNLKQLLTGRVSIHVLEVKMEMVDELVKLSEVRTI